MVEMEFKEDIEEICEELNMDFKLQEEVNNEALGRIDKILGAIWDRATESQREAEPAFIG